MGVTLCELGRCIDALKRGGGFLRREGGFSRRAGGFSRGGGFLRSFVYSKGNRWAASLQEGGGFLRAGGGGFLRTLWRSLRSSTPSHRLSLSLPESYNATKFLSKVERRQHLPDGCDCSFCTASVRVLHLPDTTT